MAFDPRQRRPRVQQLAPRRVVGGIKPARFDDGAIGWQAQRWLRVIDQLPGADALRQGIEYAELGQTRSLVIETGAVRAVIQGRRPRALRVALHVRLLDGEAWDRVTDAVLADASLAAPLLAGDLPKRIEDVFTPVGSALVPATIEEITPECSCGAPEGVWCKHAVCAMRLAADLLHIEPLAVIRLRGRDSVEFLDRLRRRRAARGSAVGSTPAYQVRVDLPESAIPPALEDSLESFWEGDPRALDALDTTPEPVEPTHALLRRLGPPPVVGSKFPLVGLLASCYDRIAADALPMDASDAQQDESPAEAPPPTSDD